MQIEILATGEELKTGAVVDTNSAYIAEQLEQIGLSVSRHTCVGDDLFSLASVLQEISGRADLVIVTGGLGPTQDDVTAEAASRAVDRELKLFDEALIEIKSRFYLLNRAMSPSNEKQAYFPEGAEWLPNLIGTAPGFSLMIQNCLYFFLPGVPAEMKKMFSEQVIPHIQKKFAKNLMPINIKTYSIFGLPESVVDEKLAAITEKFPEIKLSIRAVFPDIQIKLCAKENQTAELNKAADFVIEQLGEHIFSDRNESMEDVVGNLLRKRHATLSIAESCTGGLIAHQITSVSGSAEYFMFSGVTYSNEAKISILNIKSETLKKYGAVSLETAREMAANTQKLMNTTYAISTTGIAGPTGETKGKPVGTICIGLAEHDEILNFCFHFPFGNRKQKQKIFAMMALDLLRRKILGLPLKAAR